jgi:hypothetical protein
VALNSNKYKMKKKTLILLLLLLYNNVYTQKKIFVIDSITKKILPFAELQIGNNIIYTNEKGFFIFNNKSKKNGIIHYLGYESRLVDFTKMDTVLLKPKQYELDKIVLSSKKRELKINILHINKKYFGSFPLTKGTEILTLITPKSNELVGKINKVSFKFDKISYNKKLYAETTNAFIRVNIYANDSSLTKIFSSEPYRIKKNKKDLVSIDLSEKNIKMPKKGLLFGLEYIGHTDKNGNFINNKNLIVRTSLTDQESNIYNQTTFLRSAFLKKIIIQSFNNYFYSLDKKKAYNRNLSISFVTEK